MNGVEELTLGQCKHCNMFFFHMDYFENHLRRWHQDLYMENPNVIDHVR